MNKRLALALVGALAGCGSGKPAAMAPAPTHEETATPDQTATPPVKQEPAPTKPEIGTFGFDRAGMDITVQPGDSFFSYANGTWMKNTPIPADKPNYGMFTALADKS